MALERRKKILVFAGVLLVVVLGCIYAWSVFGPKPICDCQFPNTDRYGVIRNGKCVIIDCERTK